MPSIRSHALDFEEIAEEAVRDLGRYTTLVHPGMFSTHPQTAKAQRLRSKPANSWKPSQGFRVIEGGRDGGSGK